MKKNNNAMFDARNTAEMYQMERQKKRQPVTESFMSQDIDIFDYLWAPNGMEKPAIAVYAVLAPYMAGLVFMYIFIAHGNIDHFLVLDWTMFFLVWAIGYEFLGSLLLLGITIAFGKFLYRSRQPKVEEKGRGVHNGRKKYSNTVTYTRGNRDN